VRNIRAVKNNTVGFSDRRFQKADGSWLTWRALVKERNRAYMGQCIYKAI